MDMHRNREYDTNKFNNNVEVVKMVTIPLTKEAPIKTVRGSGVKNQKKKRSALEISDSIGVHGAFGRTLSELHKQGR